MSDALAIFAILGGFLVAFPLFWCAVVGLIARIGGWQRLAQDFHGTEPPEGEHFGWRSGSLGWFGNYRNVLDVWVSGHGI